MNFFFLSARLIKVERPLYGVEVFVGETARFEIEISEPDVHPIWKLKGETLTPSPVRLLLYSQTIIYARKTYLIIKFAE